MRRGGRSAADRWPITQIAREATSGATPRGRLGAAFVLAAALAAVGPDRLARGPRLCPISAVIRRPCPGCGMTRAAAALLRGDIGRAIRTNPRIMVVAAIGCNMLMRDVRALVAQRRAQLASPPVR